MDSKGRLDQWEAALQERLITKGTNLKNLTVALGKSVGLVCQETPSMRNQILWLLKRANSR